MAVDRTAGREIRPSLEEDGMIGLVILVGSVGAKIGNEYG